MDVETFYDGILAAPLASSASPLAPKAETSTPPPLPPPSPADRPRNIVATPYAKKLVKQHKVYIEKVIGTGPYGWITLEDVEKAAGIAPTKSPTPVAAPVAIATAVAPVKTPVVSPVKDDLP